jgi:cytochrome c-type biogenesis protein CcmE
MKGRRTWMAIGLVAIVGALVLLVAGGLRDNIVYFLTPTELAARGSEVYDAPLRLGGQVKPNTVEWNVDSGVLRFVITDGETDVPVLSSGAPPTLFSEGIGVVVEGAYREDGVFRSNNVMVKHSNEYRPPEEGREAKDLYRSLIIEDGS